MSPPGKNSGWGVDVEDGAIVQLRQHRVVERCDEHVVDQHLAQPAAATVSHLHGGVVADRNRADHSGGEVRAGVVGHQLRPYW